VGELAFEPRLHAAPYFASALFSGALALSVVFTGRGAARRPFYALALAVGGVLVGTGLVQLAGNARTATLVGRGSQAMAILVPAVALELASTWLTWRRRAKATKILWVVAVAMSLLTVTTPWVIADARPWAYGFTLTAGPIYPISLGIVSLSALAPLSFFGRLRRERRVREREQFWALTVAGTLALFAINDALPVMGIDAPPFGWVPLLAAASVLGWALVRYNLLDVRLAMTRVLLWGALTLAGAFPFVLLGAVALPRLEGRSFGAIAAVALALVLLVRLFLFVAQPPLDALVWRRHRDLQAELRLLAARITRIQDPAALGATVDRFLATLDRRLAALVLLDERGRPRIAHSAWGAIPAPTPKAPLFDELLAAGGLVFRDARGSQRVEIERACIRWGAELLGPLVEGDRLRGIVAVSPRLHGGAADGVELDALRRLCALVTTALAGVRLYEQVQRLSDELERKAAARAAELAQAVDELRGAEAKLVESETLATLGHVVAGISADLRRQVERASTSVAILRESAAALAGAARAARPNDPRVAEDVRDLGPLLDAMTEGARRAYAIAEELSRFAAPTAHDLDDDGAASSARREPAQLAALADATLGLLQRQLGDVAIVRDYDENLPPISVEIGPLEQVVLNLVMNAVQAMRGSGTLTLSTRRVGRDEVELAVGDTGPGISPDVLPRIFEPFFSTKGAGGTGLGLPVSWGIVARHGGRILVETQPGVGAIFRVRLPVGR
jgi:two-component system NtrC family sensor kinase